MHPAGSTAPPPLPPSRAEASTLLLQFQRLLANYNSLVRDWNINGDSVRAIFERHPHINRRDLENLVERAEVLVGTLRANAFINPATNRGPAEEYGMLERLRPQTEDDLNSVAEELQSLERAIRENQRPARPIDQNAQFSPPSREVLQLRRENTVLRDENARLGEELREAQDDITTLEERVAFLEGRLASRE